VPVRAERQSRTGEQNVFQRRYPFVDCGEVARLLLCIRSWGVWIRAAGKPGGRILPLSNTLG